MFWPNLCLHTAGVSGDTPLASRPQLANAHGAIQVIGWGLLLPIGALLARYCRAWDPIWFYLHVTFQIIGFMFVIAGIGTGLVLSKRVRPSRFYTHQALGITVFFLACLQVKKKPILLALHNSTIETTIILLFLVSICIIWALCVEVFACCTWYNFRTQIKELIMQETHPCMFM